MAGAWKFISNLRTDIVAKTLPETNSSPLKMDRWKTNSLLGNPIFRGKLLVFWRVSILAWFQIRTATVIMNQSRSTQVRWPQSSPTQVYSPPPPPPPKIDHFKRKGIIFKPSIFRGYLSFRGGSVLLHVSSCFSLWPSKALFLLVIALSALLPGETTRSLVHQFVMCAS